MNYSIIYQNLIKRGQQRKSSDVEGERHHIVPRCMGGSDAKVNLVKLPYREHLFAHRLLCRIYPMHHGLAQAVARIQRKYKVTGKEQYKLYEADRRRVAVMLSLVHKGKTLSDEHKARISQFHKGRKQPSRAAEHSQKLGEAHRGIPCPQHVKDAVARAATGRIKSEEERAKISAAQKGKVVAPNARALMSVSSKGRVWVHNEEKTKRVKQDELELYLANGFSLGRC
jgi:hypothetical protein